MTALVIERPKDVDLAELFEINVKIIPGLAGNKSPVLDWRTIPLGATEVYWTIPASAADTIDGLLIYWPQRKKYEWACFTSGAVRVFQFDILSVHIEWSI